MCVVDVPVTSIVETIDTVARHGAGRVVETIVSGRVRHSALALTLLLSSPQPLPFV